MSLIQIEVKDLLEEGLAVVRVNFRERDCWSIFAIPALFYFVVFISETTYYYLTLLMMLLIDQVRWLLLFSVFYLVQSLPTFRLDRLYLRRKPALFC